MLLLPAAHLLCYSVVLAACATYHPQNYLVEYSVGGSEGALFPLNLCLLPWLVADVFPIWLPHLLICLAGSSTGSGSSTGIVFNAASSQVCLVPCSLPSSLRASCASAAWLSSRVVCLLFVCAHTQTASLLLAFAAAALAAALAALA